MKKKSLWKDIFKDIKGSLGRFIAIISIIALGVAFFTGLKIAPEDMKLTADKYYDDYNFMDIRILSTLGITEDDVDAVEKIEGVERARGSYFLDVIAENGEREIALRIHDFVDKDQVNAPRVIEGRLPENEKECVIELGNQNILDIEIGSTLKLNSGKDEDLEEDLKNTEFEVVGYIQSPNYLSFEKGSTDVGSGQLRDFIMIPRSNFKMEAFTDMYITVEDVKSLNSYNDEYFDRVEPVEDRIEAIASEREDIRYDEIYDEAKEEIEDGREEYEEEKKKAEEELDKARNELDEARAEIEDGEKELQENEEEFYSAIQEGEDELAKSEKELDKGEAEYQEGLKEYREEKKKAEKEFTKAEEDLKEAEEGIETLKENISKIESNLENPELPEEQKQELEEQKAELESTLSETREQYESGKKELEEAKEEFNSQKGQAEEEFAKAEKELEQAEEKINSLEENINNIEMALKNPDLPEEERLELEAQLAELKPTLEGARKEYEAGREELEKNRVEFQKQEAQAQEEFKQAEKELEEAQQGIATLEENISKIQSAIDDPQIPEEQRKELEAQLEELKVTLADTREQYESGKAELAKGRQELDDAKEKLDSSKQELDKARSKLNEEKENLASERRKGEKELQEARDELADARKELQEGEAEYQEEKAKAEEELEDAKSDIEDAEEELEDLDEAQWHVLNRDQHYSYVDYGGAADRIDALAKVFPIFFALVAALVTLTTMTRMVDEQRMTIGTLKALGYRRRDIVSKYLIYSFAATLLGVILGIAIGYTVFPIIIFNAYALMYAMPSITLGFNWNLALIVGLVAIALTTFTSFLASSNELKENPASLMRPKAPRIGKTVLLEKIPFIWNRFNFNYKVTVRNLFRYKRRFFMTVFGIAGCTALILAGFGIRDSIQTVVDKQYGEVYSYDMEVGIEDDGAEVLEEERRIEKFKLTHTEGANLTFNGEEKDINIIVPKELDDFDRFIQLQNRKTDKRLDLNEGLIITEGMSREIGLEQGDTIELENADEEKVDVEVKNIAENYTFNYIYMTNSQYESLFSKPLEYNSALTMLKDEYKNEEDTISRELLSNDDITNLSFISTEKEDLDDTIKSLNYVVILMTVSAGALAFVVLYNLTNINISERVREIATIKVLGFYDNEVSAYVYRENVILTIIGTLTGLFIGIFLHRYIIETVEMESLMLGLNLSKMSYLYAAVLTVVFAVIVNIVMHYKLKNIKMVESLKSVD